VVSSLDFTKLSMKYLYILSFCALLACKGTKDTSSNTMNDQSKTTLSATTNQVKTYQELATEKLGDAKSITYEMNTSKSIVLCKKVTFTKNIPMGAAGSKPVASNTGNVQFIVVDIAKGKILHERSIAYGSVQWEDDRQIKIVEVMGAAMPNNPNMYLYDVISGKKTPIKQPNDLGVDKFEKP